MKKMAVVVCGAESEIARVLGQLQSMYEVQVGEPEDLGVCGVQSQSMLVNLFSPHDENVIGRFVERAQGRTLSIGYCECQ